MAKRIFITGIGGFIGGHLCTYLNQKGYEVYGSYFRPTGDLSIAEKNTRALWNIDVRYRPHLQEALAEVRPDIVYHLAAQSYPMVSYKEPEYTVETNVLGTLNLFECLLSLGLRETRVLLASSTAAYGFINPEETPVTEAQPMRPAHVYGMSKAAQDLLGTTYVNAHRMDVILLRIGNCVGPGRKGEVVSDFTLRRAKIDLGLMPPRFPVGNLHTQRAFLDVRDAVRCFELLQNQGHTGEAYNVSGIRAFSISELLTLVLEGAPFPIEVFTQPSLVRPVDEPIYWCDLSKVQAHTGWVPEISLRKTVRDMIEWWEQHLQSKAHGSLASPSRES